jgi:trigger factor
LAEPLIISTSKRDDHQLDMTIGLGPERTEAALHRAASQVSRKAKIPGFRPGKAPYATVLRMFGRDALLGQIMDDLGDEVYKEALEVEHIEPYGQADLKDLKTDPVLFTLVVPLRPEVHLGDYRSLRLAAPEVSPSDADVDAVLDRAAEQRATLQAVERPAALGDTVVVNIKGVIGEDTIMDNHDWEVALQGGESGWLPGFDDAFVGMAASDEKTFTLKYPEDSTSRYHGQEATFHTTVAEVRARVRPAIDDEFARSLGEYADVADLRAKTLEDLTRQRTAEAEDEFGAKAVEALVEQASFAYPPAAVDDVINEMMSELEMRVSQIGYKLQDFLRLQGMTAEGYREGLRPAAERRLKGQLALAEFASVEGIAVAPDESQAEVERLAGGVADENRARNLRETLNSEGGQFLINRDLRTRKAMARLREMLTAPPLEPTAASAGAGTTAAEVVAAAVDEPSPAPAAGKTRRTKKAQPKDKES